LKLLSDKWYVVLGVSLFHVADRRWIKKFFCVLKAATH